MVRPKRVLTEDDRHASIYTSASVKKLKSAADQARGLRGSRVEEAEEARVDEIVVAGSGSEEFDRPRLEVTECVCDLELVERVEVAGADRRTRNLETEGFEVRQKPNDRAQFLGIPGPEMRIYSVPDSCPVVDPSEGGTKKSCIEGDQYLRGGGIHLSQIAVLVFDIDHVWKVNLGHMQLIDELGRERGKPPTGEAEFS